MINKLYVFIKENKAFFITLIAIILLFNINLPYSIEGPGGYISLKERVEIENEVNFSGDMGMAYVSSTKGVIPALLIALIDKNYDIVKNSDVTLDNETIAEMNAREKIDLENSLKSAEYVAYSKANHNVTVKNTNIVVAYVKEGLPLQINDIIIKVNGKNVKTIEDIRQEEEGKNSINITVLRNNKELSFDIPLQEIDDRKVMGILIIPTYDLELDQDIKIKMKKNESGPSGGLMLSLSIYAKLTGKDLTKGDKIIGTGTIDFDGNVGEIGGVKHKLLGANKEKAKVFICPKGNYEEALKVKEDYNLNIEVIGVETFDEALYYLENR